MQDPELSPPQQADALQQRLERVERMMGAFKDVPEKLSTVVARLSSLTDQVAKVSGSGGASSASGEAPPSLSAGGAHAGGGSAPIHAHSARSSAHAEAVPPDAGAGSEDDDLHERVLEEARETEEDSLRGETSSGFRVLPCAPDKRRLDEICFGRQLFTLVLQPEEKSSLLARASVIPEGVKPPHLPALRSNPQNAALASQLDKLMLPARVLLDFIRDTDDFIRRMSTAWLALAAMLDKVELDEDEARYLDRALGALAANIKLAASHSADIVAAAQASGGNKDAFIRLARGLQAAPAPAFVTPERFEVLKKVADSANSIAAIQTALHIAPPNGPPRKKRPFSGNKGAGKRFRPAPAAAPASGAETAQQPTGVEAQQRLTSTWAPRRGSFRGRGKSSGQK